MQTGKGDNILIQFLRPWSIYAPGDTVAFEVARAQALIDGGVAQRRPLPAATAPAKPQDKPPKSPEKKKAAPNKPAATQTGPDAETPHECAAD